MIVFASQVRDLLGPEMIVVPADFFDKCSAFWAARHTVNGASVAVAAVALGVILVLRRFAPRDFAAALALARRFVAAS